MRGRALPRDPLPALLAEVRRCTTCAAHLPHGVRPVLQADRRARVLLAGQAPGRRVHASGLPFDDPSGDRLREWLGVTREEFYDPVRFAIVPMGFCYPGTGKAGDLPPREECAPLWRARVLSAMPAIEFSLVIGRYAQAYHLPDGPASVTEAVRDWERTWPRTVALPHPSPRNLRWFKRNPWFDRDVVPRVRRRVRSLLDGTA